MQAAASGAGIRARGWASPSPSDPRGHPGRSGPGWSWPSSTTPWPDRTHPTPSFQARQLADQLDDAPHGPGGAARPAAGTATWCCRCSSREAGCWRLGHRRRRRPISDLRPAPGSVGERARCRPSPASTTTRSSWSRAARPPARRRAPDRDRRQPGPRRGGRRSPVRWCSAALAAAARPGASRRCWCGGRSGAALTPVERMRGQLAGIDGRTMGTGWTCRRPGMSCTRLGDTMNRMLERLEGAYATQKTFVSDASHELRSPLATVRASVELASADPTGRVWEETRGTLMAEILRLQALVDDLLTLSKYDAGALPLRTRECDLDDLVVAAVRRLRGETDLAVEVSLEPVRAVADPDRLGQVLRNLLDNAARHAASRGPGHAGGSADGARGRDRGQRRCCRCPRTSGPRVRAVRPARRHPRPRLGWQRSRSGHRRRPGARLTAARSPRRRPTTGGAGSSSPPPLPPVDAQPTACSR